MRRGEIRWHKFKASDKKRPVLILTRTSAIEYLNELSVAPLTSTIREIPSEVVLSPGDGVPAACAVNLDHVQTVPKTRIGRPITTLSQDRMQQVQRALSFALGFD